MKNTEKKWSSRLKNSLCPLLVPLNQSYLTGMSLWFKKGSEVGGIKRQKAKF